MMKEIPSKIRRLAGAAALCAILCSIWIPASAKAQGLDFRSINLQNTLDELDNLPLAQLTPELEALWSRHYADFEVAGREDDGVPGDMYLQLLELWAEEFRLEHGMLLMAIEARLGYDRACFMGETETLFNRLIEIDPDLWLPAVMLHLQAWQSDFSNQHGFQVKNYVRLRDWTAMMVERRGGTPQARAEAAAFLTYWAESIWNANYDHLAIRAETLLSKAAELAPEAIAPRYLRGMFYEKGAQYRNAYNDFKALTEQAPERGDLSLRLAVQQARLKKKDEAAERFVRLVADPETESWVRAVAFQEHVRLEWDRGGWVPGREILLKARREMPANPRLAAMEVELHRREAMNSGSPAGSLARVMLDERALGDGLSPRARYSMAGPTLELVENRRFLQELVAASMPRLAEAVAVVKTQKRKSRKCRGAWIKLLPSEEPVAWDGEFVNLPPGLLFDPSPSAVLTRASLNSPSPILTPEAAPQGSAVQNVYIDPESGEEIEIHDAVDLELQTIYVTAVNLLGKHVDDLKREEVSVVDDGRKQKIVTFAQGVPFTATILLDASGSMEGEPMDRALRGVRAFIDAMGPYDRARLIAAADQLRGVSDFLSVDDGSIADFAAQLDQTDAFGGTALADYLMVGMEALRPELGRKVVVVLSDGFDLISAIPMESALEAVRRGRVQLYWIRLTTDTYMMGAPIPTTGWRRTSETREEIERLRKAVEVSGGRVLDVAEPGAAVSAFAQIVDELRAQIAIGYYPDPKRGDGSWREVNADAQRSGVRLRHTAGYFDE